MRALVTAIVVGGALVALAAPLAADIEGTTTFSSKANNVRMTLPRGWRASDQATYPGVLLRMNHTKPRLTILLAVDPAPAPDAIDPACRDRPPAAEGATALPYPREVQIACQQARRLVELGFTTGPIKEAARPWFDYASKSRELRQGIAVLGDQVFTLVLAADTQAARAQYARTFDRALRSLRVLESEESPDATGDAGVPALDDGGVAPPDAGVGP